MKTKLLFAVLFTAFLGILNAYATVPPRAGLWKFDDASNLLKADIGSALVLTGTQTSVNGPAEGNLATEIGLGSYLTMTHGIAANGGGTLVNEFTLQIDFQMPEASLWHAIYQTAADNSDDAELFINTDNAIGAWRYAYSTDLVASGTWYRMVISVKNGEYIRLYMNGQIWIDGSAQEVDGRDALQSALILFGDNDGEDNTMLCSEVAIWDVALSTEEVFELGDASTSTNGIGNLQVNASEILGTYPNPSDQFSVVSYKTDKQADVTFSILDFTGKEVMCLKEGVKTSGEYSTRINTSELSNGIYFIRMVNENKISLRKLVVTR